MSCQNCKCASHAGLTRPTTISSIPTYSNARGVLCESIPPINISDGGINSTKLTGTTVAYDGALIPWTIFTSDVSTFFNSAMFQRAIERCVEAPVAPNTEMLCRMNPVMLLDFIEVGSDENMYGRFSTRVFEPVKAVVATLESAQFGQEDELAEVPLPNRIHVGNVDQGRHGVYARFLEEGCKRVWDECGLRRKDLFQAA